MSGIPRSYGIACRADDATWRGCDSSFFIFAGWERRQSCLALTLPGGEGGGELSVVLVMSLRKVGRVCTPAHSD